MLETLYNGLSSWISVTPTTLPATTFSGKIALGVNGLTCSNANNISKTINQGMLKNVYSDSSTWLSVTSTTLPATTFTGHITCNT